MFTRSVSRVHLSLMNDPSVLRYATASCDTLMAPTSLVNVPSQNIAHDLAMIDLFETMIRSPMIVWLLMNLFEAIGHVDRLDQ